MRFDDWRPERIEQRVADIVGSIERIRSYIAGLSRESFLADEVRQDAVARQFLIVAEAADKIFALEEKYSVELDRRVQSRLPTIPWKLIRAIGVRIRHVYGREDARELWSAATDGSLEHLEVALRDEFSL